jgi:predicted metal-dependent HD superfamily phosphohydrolase
MAPALPPDLAALFAPLMDGLRRAYESPGRSYHTWAHIEACLREAAGLRFDDARAVYAALLYHDAVYVPGAKGNEALSAELAVRELGSLPGFTPQRIARVQHLIMLTASHAGLAADAPRDDALLVDIDLSILAAPADAYARYAAQVREECVPGVVSAALYANGRAAFLRGMLAAPRVFHSPEFASREAQAHANMESEVLELEKPAR